MSARPSVLTWRGAEARESTALSARAHAVLADPQGFGNYMTYRDAYRILGWDPAEIYRDGRIALDREEWADLGWLANHIGPSPKALEAMRAAVDERTVGPYSPDLSHELRELFAEKLFGRSRDETFEVIGTEGAQAGVGYSALACLDPGDEVIVTDPGYFHFVPALRLAGAEPVWVGLDAGSGWRLDPDRVSAAMTDKTKMVVVCDPINPFGTVQSREELVELLELSAARGIVLLSDTTHAQHRVDPDLQHHHLSALSAEVPGALVLATSGMAHGFGMAGARLGALGGPPELIRAALQVKIAAVRLNTSALAHAGAAAALNDEEWLREGEAVIRRNLDALCAIAEPLVKPAYGFSCVLEVGRLGVTAQELTVALCARKVAVYPGDGLGESGALDTIRINISDPEPRALQRLADVWDDALAEARSGIYRDGVRDFFLSANTDRTMRLARLLEAHRGGNDTDNADVTASAR